MGDVYTPSTRPGHRLPHAWLKKAGERVSTHDLCGRGRFVLFTGAKGAVWQEAARAAAERCGIAVDVHAIGAPGQYVGDDGAWGKLKQIAEDGAILVRPDTHVGWRSETKVVNPADVLCDALSRILGRG
jgi:2,4-dichlorophenol 6-monooxygenase